MAIDQRSAQPLSVQVRDDLRRRITAGEFTVGQKIPSLRALSAEYGIAELTVHAAVKALQHEGILESASGRGTFVRTLPTETPDDTDVHTALDALRSEVADLRSRVEAIEQEHQS